MATFQITAPNGKRYRVTGDDPSGAMAALQKMIGSEPAEPVNVDPATNQPPGVPEFKPVGVEGYNPQTGVVETSKTDSALSGAADTAGFGFGDELAAVPATIIDNLPGGRGKGYSDVLGEIRDMQTKAQQDNSKSYLAGQVGGGLAQGLVAGPGVLASAPTVAGRVLGGMVTGGGLGGIYGLGSGEGLAGRLYEGAKDAGIGAFAGGLFPVAGKMASAGYQKVVDALAGNAAAKAAGTTPEVAKMLSSVLDADGTLGPRGQANIAAAGPDAMLADAGPNAKAILDTAIQRGGPGGVAARDAIAARTANATDAVTNALDTSLGKPQGVTATKNAIRQGTSSARQSAYDAAYSAPIDYARPEAMAIENAVKTRVPKSAIDAANDLMRTTEGNSSKQILAKVADDGSVTFEKLPDVRQLDYITRGLNEVADQANGAGALGGTTPRGRAYSDLSREIRDNLRTLVPEYGQALDTAADPIRRSQALDLGSRLLSPSVTRDQAQQAIQGMTNAEKDALAQGVRSHLYDTMANVTRTIADGDVPAREAVKAIKDLSSTANREKLTAAIGDARASALFDEIDRAAKSFDLRAAMTENSKTFARQATDARVRQITEPGAVGQFLQGKPLNASQRIVQAMTGNTPEAIAARQNDVYSQLADVLTQPAGQGAATFNALQQLGTKSRANQLMADRIYRAIAGPHLSYPTTALSADMLRTQYHK